VGIYPLILCFGSFLPLMVSMARRIFRSPETISTPAWLLVTNVLFILGGPIISWAIYGEDLTKSTRGAATVAGVIVAYSVLLAGTYFAVSRIVAGLVGLHVESSVASLKRISAVAKPAEVLRWAVFVIAVQVISLSLYSLGLTGGTMAYDYKLRVPYAMLALYMLVGGASLGMAALLAKIALGQSDPQYRLAAAALLVAEYAITVFSGRRELIWLTLAVAFGVIWSGRRRWIVAAPFAIGLVYVVMFLFAPVFLRARALYSGGNAPSVAEAYQIAFEERSTDITGKTDFEAQRNTSWRFRTYAFWEQFYDERGPAFTQGKILAQAALMTLPRVIFGFAKFSLGVVDENLLETRFDICNNVSLESYVDLGMLGPVVYGVVFGVAFALCDALICFSGSRYRMVAALNIGVILRQLLGPEANPIAYFSELRTCLIYALLAVLFAILLGRKTMLAARETSGEGMLFRPRQDSAVVPPVIAPSPSLPVIPS
jgi:hypothetical protein